MGQTMSFFWSQSFFLPDPTFTEKNLPDQTGKVHIITGGYTGVGLELVKLIYPKNATVYIAGRSPSKAETAISSLRKQFPNSKGRLEFLQVDLSDLSTIKRSAQEFLNKEQTLNVLVNNAGVMTPPEGSKGPQGFDLQTVTNIYGPWMFTSLLLPILKETAKTAETGSVRVAWAASLAVDVMPLKGGVLFGKDGLVDGTLDKRKSYAQSKAANVLLGIEGARRYGNDGILMTSFNPGNLRSELQRHSNAIQGPLIKWLCFPVKFGGYTELYAGWSPDITPDMNGAYVIPWGRVSTYNQGLQKAAKRKEDGGEGAAERLWDTCEKVCRQYL